MLILLICLVKLGHYKAEEWQDSSKTWTLNDQLGIQIVVTVRHPDPCSACPRPKEAAVLTSLPGNPILRYALAAAAGGGKW